MKKNIYILQVFIFLIFYFATQIILAAGINNKKGKDDIGKQAFQTNIMVKLNTKLVERKNGVSIAFYSSTSW